MSWRGHKTKWKHVEIFYKIKGYKSSRSGKLLDASGSPPCYPIFSFVFFPAKPGTYDSIEGLFGDVHVHLNFIDTFHHLSLQFYEILWWKMMTKWKICWVEYLQATLLRVLFLAGRELFVVLEQPAQSYGFKLPCIDSLRGLGFWPWTLGGSSLGCHWCRVSTWTGYTLDPSRSQFFGVYTGTFITIQSHSSHSNIERLAATGWWR